MQPPDQELTKLMKKVKMHAMKTTKLNFIGSSIFIMELTVTFLIVYAIMLGRLIMWCKNYM